MFEFRDSLTGQDRRITSPRGRPVGLYVCGPTVYDAAHVGHGRTYLYFDVIRRYLHLAKAKVRHVMNITDFEDKITQRAQQIGLPWEVLARREEQRFHSDLAALGAFPADIVPRASEFVPQMIEIVRALERTGRVTRRGDEWYFDPPPEHRDRNFPVGTDLARHAVPEPGHPFPTDGIGRAFMVWKRQEPPAPSWPSPWGPGAPGWHLECYAMAHEYLGIPVDIHGGGVDLVFPHHYSENEIALTLENTPFSRGFLHTGFVLENGRKMSKSVGNLVTLRSALESVGPAALRWYLLELPYNERLEWSSTDMTRSAEEFEQVRERVVGSLRPGSGGSLSLARLAALREGMCRDIGEGLHVDRAFDRLRQYSRVLGRAPHDRFARGDRASARDEYRTIECLTGLGLT